LIEEMGRSDQDLLARELPCLGEKRTFLSSQTPVHKELTLDFTKPGNPLHRGEMPSVGQQLRAGQTQIFLVLVCRPFRTMLKTARRIQADRGGYQEGLRRWLIEKNDQPQTECESSWQK
jgi:hypothetical protein